MKKSLLLILQLCFVCQVAVAQEFITTWSKPLNITTISFTATTTGPVAYTWQTLSPAPPASGSGTFIGPDVTISGLPAATGIRLLIQPQNFKRFRVVPFSSFQSLEDVNQWGSVVWSSMEDAFIGESTLQVTATDIPNLTQVTSLANMFYFCQGLNSPFNLNAWNISNVTNLSGMFKDCYEFNQSLSLWNTSNVTNMSSMFMGASVYNQNMSNWNTANVTNMENMFKGAYAFNRNIGNWNTANVNNMAGMFGAFGLGGIFMTFNQNISNWNTGSVTTMSGMFKGAINFNQNIGNWNTANVTDMSEMFQKANAFNQNIGNWNTTNVTNMARMFANDLVTFQVEDPYAFTNGGSNSIQNWNTANVTNLSGMFLRSNSFNYSLGNWDLNANVNLTQMFDRSGLDCKNYSQTLIDWSNNPNTPTNKILGATFMNYGPEAQSAVTNLTLNKAWGFSGHDFNSITPSFDFPNVFCQGATIPALPVISENGIQGIWEPPLNSETTATYTFIPILGQCAETTSINITINPIASPVGNSNQTLGNSSTLANIVISPSNVIWFATVEDALANVNALSSNLALVDGTTYYAVNDNGQCRSQPFPVTVSVTLSADTIERKSLKFYPNPVTSVLQISYNNLISSIEIYNILGQLLIRETLNSTNVSIEMTDLASSIYLVKIKSENQTGEFKVVKQ